MTRARRVSVMMCRPEVTDFGAALRDDAEVEDVPLRDGLPFAAKLFAEFDRRNAPDWLELLAQGTADALAPHFNASNAAVLVIRRRFTARQNRYFAVSFGYGRFLLDPNAYERAFGLRVALNSIDPDELVSLDVQTLQELPFHRRIQASRAAPPGEFELDAYRDMLTSVTGRPADGSSTRMSGSDAAAVTRRVEFDDLGRLCDELAAAYRKHAYRARFGWIDHLGQVRVPEERERLDGRLIEALKARYAGDKFAATLTLAPPEIIDWLDIDGFWISGTRARRRTEGLLDHPDVDWYLTRLADRDAIAVEKIKQDRLEARRSSDEDAVHRWSLYRSLVADLPGGNRRLILVNGTWFEIARTLIDQIDTYVARLPTSTVELPPAGHDEHERDYNQRAAEAGGLYLLDRQNLPASDAQGRIESCDLLGPDGAFVHVKRYRNGSADLSHLFSQALVSATAFLEADPFRSELRAKLVELDAVSEDADRLAPADRPDPAAFEVAYAIIAPPRLSRPTDLPFFAKLTLMRTARLLEARSYRVSLTLVPTTAAEGVSDHRCN